jgi:hypothetical protein
LLAADTWVAALSSAVESAVESAAVEFYLYTLDAASGQR